VAAAAARSPDTEGLTIGVFFEETHPVREGECKIIFILFILNEN